MKQQLQNRSFGRRKVHKLSTMQSAMMNEMLPLIRPSQTFIRNVDEVNVKIWFEIGFGSGEHLIDLLERTAYDDNKPYIIGCEPYINGTVKVLQYINDKSINNLMIWCDDARDLMLQIGDGLVEKWYILFPDPWPKKRHHKRRIINDDMLKLLTHKTSINGILTIATDHTGYAEWIKCVLDRFSDCWYIEYKTLYNVEECSNHHILTRYCQKALLRGDIIHLFSLCKR